MTVQPEQQPTDIGPSDSRRASHFIGAIAGNAILAGIFIKALLYPADNAEFIVKTAALIFVIEFLAIHSGMFLMFMGGISTAFGKIVVGILFIIFNWRKVTRAGDIVHGVSHYEKTLKPLTIFIKVIIFSIPIAFYTVFALSWGQNLGNLELPIYFGISLASKHFGKRAFSSDFPMTREEMIGPSKWTMWFLISAFIPVGLACQLERWFPFPEEIYFLSESSWMVSGSSPCLGAPHHWVAWGALYYGMIVIIETILGIRRLRRATTKVNS